MSYTCGGGGEGGTTLGTVTYVDGQPTLTTTAGTAGHPIEGTYGPNGEISVTVEPVAVDGQQVSNRIISVGQNLDLMVYSYSAEPGM